VKVAAYQAPRLRSGSLEAVDLIRTRVEWCESHGVVILCCPEAILGGLADDAADPREFAIDARGDQLAHALAPLASDTVTTIVGFTEVTSAGRLYNTAAVFHKGSVVGLYRKLHPAINRSIYDAGDRMPVFQIDGLIFGILICNEGLLPHVGVRRIAEGAAYLVNPSNDSWVPDAGFAWQQFDIVSLRAVEERRYLIRVSDSGPSGVADPFGRVVTHTEALTRGVLLASVVPIGGRTPYAIVGDLFGVACLLATALALIRCRRRGDRGTLRT